MMRIGCQVAEAGGREAGDVGIYVYAHAPIYWKIRVCTCACMCIDIHGIYMYVYAHACAMLRVHARATYMLVLSPIMIHAYIMIVRKCKVFETSQVIKGEPLSSETSV